MDQINRKPEFSPQTARKIPANRAVVPGPNQVLKPEISYPAKQGRTARAFETVAIAAGAIARGLVSAVGFVSDQIADQRRINRAKRDAKRARQLDEIPRQWSGTPATRKKPTRAKKRAVVVIVGNNNKVNISQ